MSNTARRNVIDLMHKETVMDTLRRAQDLTPAKTREAITVAMAMQLGYELGKADAEAMSKQ